MKRLNYIIVLISILGIHTATAQGEKQIPQDFQ